MASSTHGRKLARPGTESKAIQAAGNARETPFSHRLHRMENSRRFRSVMGHFATGVTVVTGRDDRGVFGLTANAMTAVSLDPTLILVCLDWSSASVERVLDSGSFAVNVLESGQADLARRFSGRNRKERFQEAEFRPGSTGAPLLEGALAWLDCRVWRVYEGGDHAIVVGEVLECHAGDGEPLIFFRGRYREYEP